MKYISFGSIAPWQMPWGASLEVAEVAEIVPFEIVEADRVIARSLALLTVITVWRACFGRGNTKQFSRSVRGFNFIPEGRIVAAIGPVPPQPLTPIFGRSPK